jgi:gas vesicle protein
MNKNNTIGLMIGFGLGVGVALLFAPKSGDRTRLLIARTTRDGADYLKSQATALRDSASDFIEKGQEEVARHAEGLRRAVEIGKRTYQESVG